ncbi:MAG: hypothetical protein ACRBDL_01210 [Alphaproteobacteria bacterium]
MTVRSLFQDEPHVSALKQAMETLKETNGGFLNMVMDLDDGSHPLYANLKSPIQRLLKSKEGLEKAKDAYDQMAPQFPSVHAAHLIMTCLYGLEDNTRNTENFLVHALKTADTDTQVEFLNARVFNPENIEHQDFNTQQAHRLFQACTEEAQNDTRDNIRAMTFEKLAFYTYGVQVSRKNPDMARVETGDVAIPFHMIENDNVRAYCQENEDQIHNHIKDLHTPFSDEGLKTVQATYEKYGMDSDAETIIKNRIASTKQEIIGDSPEQHLEKFQTYQRALQVALIKNSDDLESAPAHD